MTTCVYAGLGVHTSVPGKINLMSHFDRFIGFEPNPYQYTKILEQTSHIPGVEIYNVAVSDNDNDIEYHISNNDTGSSVYPINEDGVTKDVVSLKCVHLGEFLKSINVTSIDMYLSDVQGNDLTAIKSMEQLLLSRSIGSIQAEVHGLTHNLYPGSNNKLVDFLNYRPLTDNYNFKSVSFDGTVHNNNNDILKDILEQFEYDITWVLK